MKHLILSACACTLLTACATQEQSALAGAAAGAALGLAVTERHEGALIGAVSGAATGLIVHGANEGPQTRRDCYIRNRDGSRTYVNCPN